MQHKKAFEFSLSNADRLAHVRHIKHVEMRHRRDGEAGLNEYELQAHRKQQIKRFVLM